MRASYIRRRPPALFVIILLLSPLAASADNKAIDKRGLSTPDKEKGLNGLTFIDSVLGVMALKRKEADQPIADLIEQREQARRSNDWTLADRLRTELRKKGFEVMDTKDGPRWYRVRD